MFVSFWILFLGHFSCILRIDHAHVSAFAYCMLLLPVKAFVLVLAEIGLILLHINSSDAVFYMSETVLITLRVSSYHWAQCQGFLCLSSCPPSKLAGGAQRLRRGHSQDRWPPKRYPIPYNFTPRNKSWGKEGGRGNISSDGICLPK